MHVKFYAFSVKQLFLINRPTHFFYFPSLQSSCLWCSAACVAPGSTTPGAAIAPNTTCPCTEMRIINYNTSVMHEKRVDNVTNKIIFSISQEVIGEGEHLVKP